MRIRQGRRADAPAIAGIHVRSWQAAFAGVIPQDYLDEMDPRRDEPGWDALLAEEAWPRAGILVAERQQGVVAFTGFAPVQDEPSLATVRTFYLLPEVWGSGVAKPLMVAMLATLDEAGYEQAVLWVLEANARARRFYEAAGWRADGATEFDTTGGAALTKLRYRRALKREPR